MILYLRDPEHSTGRLSDLLNDFSKLAGYKINIKETVAFSYTNNDHAEKEIRKTIPQ
jgi:hypothetical protein